MLQPSRAPPFLRFFFLGLFLASASVLAGTESSPEDNCSQAKLLAFKGFGEAKAAEIIRQR